MDEDVVEAVASFSIKSVLFISYNARMRGVPHEFNYFFGRGDDVMDLVNYLVSRIRFFDGLNKQTILLFKIMTSSVSRGT